MEEKTWGVRFNEHPDHQRYAKGKKPQGCPDWLESYQIITWQEQGLVIWNSIDKRIATLHGYETLMLLSQLDSHDDWKSDGISITRLVHELKIPLSPRGRRKKTEQEPKVETTKAEPVYQEILHLPPEAGPELIELLQTNKLIISELADREKKRLQEAIRRCLEAVLEFSIKKEQNEFDFDVRPFEWRCQDKSRWLCQHQTAEGRVCLEKSKLFWHACVIRPGYTRKSDHFMKLQAAVEWVEKELVDLANLPETQVLQPRIQTKQQSDRDRVRLRKKLLAGPYWIDSTVMEPMRVTYKTFIELDARPISFKTYESICGDTLRYDERYLSPYKLAAALNLDIDHLNVDQPVGENSEWYRITSLTTYYQEPAAAEQVQKAWDESQILQQFKSGKISRARYGYQEVETGFVVHLGACEDPDNPWEQPISRKEHMELRALQESLSFALDVTGYRDYLGVSAELISDARILRIMHKTRTRSKYLSEEIKRESKIWLAQNDPLEQ